MARRERGQSLGTCHTDGDSRCNFVLCEEREAAYTKPGISLKRRSAASQGAWCLAKGFRALWKGAAVQKYDGRVDSLAAEYRITQA
jgi:hypothetical protein